MHTLPNTRKQRPNSMLCVSTPFFFVFLCLSNYASSNAQHKRTTREREREKEREREREMHTHKQQAHHKRTTRERERERERGMHTHKQHAQHKRTTARQRAQQRLDEMRKQAIHAAAAYLHSLSLSLSLSHTHTHTYIYMYVYIYTHTQQDKGRSRDWTKSSAYKQYTQQQSAAQSLLSYLAPQVLSLLALLVQKYKYCNTWSAFAPCIPGPNSGTQFTVLLVQKYTYRLAQSLLSCLTS